MRWTKIGLRNGLEKLMEAEQAISRIRGIRSNPLIDGATIMELGELASGLCMAYEDLKKEFDTLKESTEK